MQCEICEKRLKLIKKLDKIGKRYGEFARERARTNVMSVEDPRTIMEKGLTEQLEEKETCPKCGSSIMDVGTNYEQTKHKHVCSKRCGWESKEFKGTYVEVI